VTGVACGRLVTVTASETTSVAWLYDITNIASPDLVKTFHLSPALETKSPGLAYNEGRIGEVDPENFLFLTKEQAPGGKEAIMFGGAQSGTISYWEFDCVEDERPAHDMDCARGILKLAPLSVFLVTAASFFFTTL
jgi:hypothetical protein